MLNEPSSFVAIVSGPREYDVEPPFSPADSFPEYRHIAPKPAGRPNQVYRAVREALRLLQLDAPNLDAPNWNPLREFVSPGDTVVLKPNFVRDFRESSPDDADCLVTHGSVLRVMVDYAYLALRGEGRIVIADAPQNDADFQGLREIVRFDAIQEFYRSTRRFDVEVCDLRPEAAVKIDGVIVDHLRLAGDPAGYVKVDLGDHSAFAEIANLCARLYGAEYDRAELINHHLEGRHEYLLSKTVMEADCVVGIPKLKTHKKTGLTANLKNLVGINGNKNWLPHHREGTPRDGGDQFADSTLLRATERRVVAAFKRCFPLLGPLRRFVARPVKSMGRTVFGDTNRGTVRSGNWYGNDTTWRMVIDLNRILFYADARGALHDHPVRKFFSVVDGIVGGEGNGPLDPTPKKSGLVLAGVNPVAVDLACARVMGFDYRRIPVLTRALAAHPLPLVNFSYQDVTALSNDARFRGRLCSFNGRVLAFEPHFGWKGSVEIPEEEHEAGAVA